MRPRGGTASPSRSRPRDRGKTIWLNFSGHQLPRQHLAERQADREGDGRRRSMAHLRVQRDRCREGRRGKCARGAGLGADRHRPRHHLRRLEPGAARQEHGPVARGLCHDQRPGGGALSGGGFARRCAGQCNSPRSRRSSRMAATSRCMARSRARSTRSSFSRMSIWRRTRARTWCSIPPAFPQLNLDQAAAVVAGADGKAGALSIVAAVPGQRR